MSQHQTIHAQIGSILPHSIETETITRHDSVKIVPFLCSPEVHQKLFSYQQETSVEISVMSENGQLVSLVDFLLQLKNRPNPEAILTTWDLRAYSKLTESDFVWEVADDEGLFKFDPLLDNEIKTAQRDATQHQRTTGCFLHGNVLCTIFFDLFLMETGPVVTTRRSIRKSTPYWSYYAGSEVGYIRHEDLDSKNIERMYKYGGKHSKMGGTEYMFSFGPSEAFQIDIRTGEEVQITRYPPMIGSSPREIIVEIHIKGFHANVLEVNQWLNDLVLNNSKDQEINLQLQVSDKMQSYLFHQIVNVTREYCVSCTCSAEPANKVCVKMNGAPSYVNEVCILLKLLTSESQQDLQSVTSSTRDVPEEWGPQTNECEIKIVPKGNREWNGVNDLVRKTMPNVEIQKLERIQNQDLWEKFSLERKQMKRRNNGEEINEKLLFHGSRTTSPRSIASSLKGVDFRYSSRVRSLMWGTGAYFAVKASYSDNYAHPVEGGLKELILVRVLTGISCSYGVRHDPSLTRPPNQSASVSEQGKPYDTVNGDTNGSTIYVVYDHDKSYPAYIITYRNVYHY